MPLAKDDRSRDCHCIKPWYSGGMRKFGHKCQLHIHPDEARLRKIFPHGMRDGVDLTIKFSIGFETFGAYEDWGQGWTFEATIDGVRLYIVEGYYDEGIKKFLEKAEAIIARRNNV